MEQGENIGKIKWKISESFFFPLNKHIFDEGHIPESKPWVSAMKAIPK